MRILLVLMEHAPVGKATEDGMSGFDTDIRSIVYAADCFEKMFLFFCGAGRSCGHMARYPMSKKTRLMLNSAQFNPALQDAAKIARLPDGISERFCMKSIKFVRVCLFSSPTSP